MRKLLIALPALAILFSACSINNVTEDDSLGRFFDSAGVKGCFALYDNGQGKFTIYNLPRYRDSAYPVGATFDIVQLLVGVQTGALANERAVLADSVTLTQAFQTEGAANADVFGKLSKLIGHDSLKKWVDSLHYGNRALDKDSLAFADGSLTIPADEQLGLIKKLYFNQLPFFNRTQEIVRGMMKKEENANYKLVYKAALVSAAGHDMGWTIGWVEENRHPYFFALNFDLPKGSVNMDDVGLQIVKHILPSMGFFEGKK